MIKLRYDKVDEGVGPLINILFVCTGNTCRSPMAEALLANKGHQTYRVKSAGVYASNGAEANPHARHVLKNRGISFERHQSQTVSSELINWADRIYAMTENHKRIVIEHFPEAADKVMTLKEAVLNSEETKDTWERYRTLLSELEMTRAMYMQKLNNEKQSQVEKQVIQQEMENEWMKQVNELKALEKKLPNLDIMDPFGGTIEEYEHVCLEIEKLIDMLIEKDNN